MVDGGAKDERQKGVCDGWRGDGPQALAGRVALGCVVAKLRCAAHLGYLVLGMSSCSSVWAFAALSPCLALRR